MASQQWASASNLLCVRLDTLGDVLMTTPALRALKESPARPKLTLLTSSPGAAVAPLIPEIDDTLVHAVPWMKIAEPRSDSSAELALIERLKAGRFDGAVIFTVFSQSPLPAALLCYLADIPLRLAHCRENPYQLLTDWIPEFEPERGIRHEVQRQLDLVQQIGCSPSDRRLSLRIPPAAQHAALRLLEEIGLDPGAPWVVVHPGATAASRRYPADHFAEVARQLALQHGIQVLFTGVESEHELIERIRRDARAPSYSLAGRLDLAEMGGLLAEAPLLIANNTGPVHIAAALGTPVVDLYALTNPQHTPWQVRHRVLSADVPCKYCYKSICLEGHHNCLRLVSPWQVVDAALELLREEPPAAQPSAPAPIWKPADDVRPVAAAV